jgi:hypothetical protein
VAAWLADPDHDWQAARSMNGPRNGVRTTGEVY